MGGYQMVQYMTSTWMEFMTIRKNCSQPVRRGVEKITYECIDH
jgi:hypothetical protein